MYWYLHVNERNDSMSIAEVEISMVVNTVAKCDS